MKDGQTKLAVEKTTNSPMSLWVNKPVLMDEGIEGQAISPTGGEVSNIDIRITSCFHLTPEEQGIFGGLGFTTVGLLDCDILDLI